MKTVLVAVDLTRRGGSDDCIRVAQGIAGTMNASMAIIYVMDAIPGYIASAVPEGTIGKRKLEAEKNLHHLAEQFGCPVSVVREGYPATEILQYASEIKADLIVLNAHDPGITDYIMGSVANRVVKHAHCSVHVFRSREAKG